MPLPPRIRLLRIILLAWIVIACGRAEQASLGDFIEHRPVDDGAIADRVGLLDDVRESTQRHLASIRDRYGIEVLIVALPSLENRFTVGEAAAELMTRWGIGKQYAGRGILLLFVDDEKKVRLEVSFDLEDVFTDAFTGHIQDVQLQPRYTAGGLDIGFIAVMEEIESRAQIKSLGNYTPASIAALDLDFLSQGAGAERRLRNDPQRGESRPGCSDGTINTAYPAGETPADAWRTLLRTWRDRVKDPNLGVYTPLTRLAYRDFIHQPDARLDQQYATYTSRSHTVRQDGDVAVIDFGDKEGWDNAPFLFCRTGEGWQFDIVHQRRFIRMGRAPHWGVEFAEHPHMKLLMDRFSFLGQDIPLSGDDRYTIDRDGELAERILAAEARARLAPDDADALLELGRLYAVTANGAKAMPLLKRVLTRSPGPAAALKYLAIAHVDAHYQYGGAQALLRDYLKAAPDDPFGHNFSGYIHYCRRAYPDAAQAFEKTLSIDPDDAYAHFYLTFTYAGLYADAPARDPRKDGFRQRFALHREKTRSLAAPQSLRAVWLDRWLERQ